MKIVRTSGAVLVSLLLLAGCSSSTAPTATAANGMPAATASHKNLRGEAKIKAELDDSARLLVSRASRTISPSKSKPSVTKSGKDFVARYIEIDPTTVHTSMRPGHKAGTYVGIIEYKEETKMCHGKTKQEAMTSTKCTSHGSRGVKELISYDGKQWQF